MSLARLAVSVLTIHACKGISGFMFSLVLGMSARGVARTRMAANPGDRGSRRIGEARATGVSKMLATDSHVWCKSVSPFGGWL